VEGGLVGHPEPTGAPQGTLVRVEDLFYNVPARMKFLKQDATERRQIDELVTRYALSYPGVQITLRQEGRITLQTSGKGERREVLAALHGVDLARQMIEVLAEEDGLRITGFISPTSLTKSNRRDILFFINGRPVQDSTLSAALLQAYHTLLMVGRYPLATIFLEIPPQAVDVNVHPTKAEVRFREPDTIFRGVQRAVRRALLAHTPIPELAGPAPAGPLPRWFPGEFQRGSSGERIPDPAWSYATNGNSIEPATATAPVQPELEKGHIPLLRPVGQIAAAYLVAEGPDGLYLIDQHAAHERVLFERFMRQWESQGTGMPGQALLTPQTISLSMASSQLIEGQLPLIEKMGFQVEVFGPGMFRIRAIPALLSGLDPADALRVLVEDFEEDETPLQAELETRMIARVCKRAAVKAGQVLSSEEQRALLADLEACRSPRTCPHGRPTMIHLSLGLLERQFGRLGPRSHGA
jgi:DNA mismatch repair protein MutL